MIDMQYQTGLWVMICFIAIVLISSLTKWLLNRRLLKKRLTKWLEITPPSSIAKTPDATEHLFSVIHGTRTSRRFKDKILGRSPIVSFEITSTKATGIRYIVQVEAHYLPTLYKAITTYLPDCKVTEINAPDKLTGTVLEFTQARHYILPITLSSPYDQHDPLSYITGAMTKLADNERITLQLVATPVQLRDASELSRRILSNEDILRRVQRGKVSVLQTVGNSIGGLMMGTTDMIGEFYSGTTHGYQSSKPRKDEKLQTQINTRQRPARTLSAFELELMESMHQKVTKPLFRVNLRIIISSDQPREHIAAFRSAFDAYSVPPYQALRARIRWTPLSNYKLYLANLRLPSVFHTHSMILASTELAGLYHFPSSRVGKTDNLISSLSKTLPAPVSLKSGKPLAVLIGENHHHGIVTPIGLTEAERERHVYIIGGTGNGKTTMLLYGIVQDIRNGKGVAVLDPHGDLAETILRHIPENRVKDVIYMNPDDLMYPIGVNLLELPEGLTGDDLLREKDLVTESTISVMRKIFSEDDSGGHRIEYILRNAIQTALTLDNPTLFTIFELLNDAKFRRQVVKNLTDKNLIDFWKNELGKAGDFQKVKMAAGITAKIGRFLFSASARRVLEQEKSTIDFNAILDEGKILICNFSKGLLGEDTSTLFGTTILAKLQLASLHRARLNVSDRKPYYLYVDEFQNFATMSFTQMLSEARKYKLFLTMAEQSTSQQDQQRLVDIILANVGTVVCFRSGSPSDERLVLPLFTPYIDQGEIANLPAYSFYARIAAVQSQEPLSGMTVLLSSLGDEEVAQRVITHSRELYAKQVDDNEFTESPPLSTSQKKIKPTPTKKTNNGLKNLKSVA